MFLGHVHRRAYHVGQVGHTQHCRSSRSSFVEANRQLRCGSRSPVEGPGPGLNDSKLLPPTPVTSIILKLTGSLSLSLSPWCCLGSVGFDMQCSDVQSKCFCFGVGSVIICKSTACEFGRFFDAPSKKGYGCLETMRAL